MTEQGSDSEWTDVNLVERGVQMPPKTNTKRLGEQIFLGNRFTRVTLRNPQMLDILTFVNEAIIIILQLYYNKLFIIYFSDFFFLQWNIILVLFIC